MPVASMRKAWLKGNTAGLIPNVVCRKMLRRQRNRCLFRNVRQSMKTDLDIVMVATRLVEELGDDAVRLAKVKLVELIAANNLRAAAFWREVMRLCEEHTGTFGADADGDHADCAPRRMLRIRRSSRRIRAAAPFFSSLRLKVGPPPMEGGGPFL